MRRTHLVTACCAVLAIAAALLVPVATAAPAGAAIYPPGEGFTDVQRAAGMAGATAVEQLPDGRLLVTTQSGTVYAVSATSNARTAVLDLSSRICLMAGTEIGLGGIAVDLDFANNHAFYLYFTEKVGDSCATDAGIGPAGAKNRVSRFELVDGDPGATLTSETAVISNLPTFSPYHNGGELKVTAGNLLWIGVGDGGSTNNATPAIPPNVPGDLRYPNGKVLRVHTDGSIPTETTDPGNANPYVAYPGSAPCTSAWGTVPCQEVWADGLRNPFRFGWDRTTLATATPKFMINDVGQDAWEEADLVQQGVGAWAGAHFGWPCLEGPVAAPPAWIPPGGCAPGVPPTLAYDRDSTGNCRSVTGGAFVPAGTWEGYDGAYVWGDFVCGKLLVARAHEIVPGATDTSPEVLGTSLGGVTDMEFFTEGGVTSLFYTTLGGELRKLTGPPPLPDASHLKFVGISPARVLDTRAGYGAPRGQVAGGTTTSFNVATQGAPTDIKAVALNLTATEAEAAGFVTLWPGSSRRPDTSSLNISGPGETVANAVVVRVDAGLNVNLFTQETTHLVADVTGYFVDAGSTVDGRFTAVAPDRLLDTRAGIGGKSTAFDPGETYDVAVAGTPSVPSGATAAIVTVTYVGVDAPGYVTVWPAGAGRPVASTSNPNGPGDIRSNLALVPLGAGGKLSVFSLVRTDLVVDLVGWFGDGGGDGGLFTAVTPDRVADSRLGLPFPRLAAGTTTTMDLDPPAGTGAVMANLTATGTVSGGYLTAFPAGIADPPFASSVNWSGPGQTRAALAVTQLTLDRAKLFSPYEVDAVIDVSGWFSQ